MKKVRCNAAGLSIGGYIGIVVGISGEGTAHHGLADDVAHLQESATVLKKGTVDDFVGSIDDSRHIAAFLDGFESQGQTAELLQVGFKELQFLSEEVKALAAERQSLRE